MAFQQGGLGSGRSAPEQPATEYTLQGVMRFLQIEWHSHERARNAWDIERAEMRAKIAKQAGELRQAKRINEQLERQVRMLENALRNERKKKGVNGAASAEKCTHTAADEVAPADSGSPRAYTSPRAPRADDGQPTAVSAATGPQDSFLHTDAPSETEREQYLDNTSKYLKNCIKEIQYLLTPPQHPPPAQVLPKGHITALPDPPLSRAEQPIYHEPDSRGNGRGQRSQVLPRQPPPLTHQPPPVPDSLPQAQAQPQYTQQVQQMGYAEYTPQGQHATDVMQPPPQQIAAPFEEQVEKVTHTYDNKGRPVLEGNQALHDSHARRVSENLHLLSKGMKEQAEADGWTFEEETPLLSEAQPADPPRRPDTDLFPSAAHPASIPAKSPPPSAQYGRRKSSGSLNMSRRRSSQGKHDTHEGAEAFSSQDSCQFKVRYALRGHLDVVRTVIFSGGGSPSEPEVCTAGDDGTIKRWIIPATYQSFNPSGPQPDLDIGARFTHRGHEGIITSLTAPPASTGFSTGGQAPGGGWIFSGGQDATIRCWERGRVDPKATLEGHTDAVWAVCVLPASVGVVFGLQSTNYGGPDRLLLVSGSADGTVKVWAVSAPPQSSPPSTGSRRGVGGTRRHSVTSGSNYPTSPQPSVASDTPFNYTLIHSIERPGDGKASPTSIYPLSPSGETFVVSYTDSCVLVFDTRTGEEIIGMASNETYDGTMNTSINSVVATSSGLEGASPGDAARGHDPDEVGGGATGGREGVEGVVITGHEDRFVRFFDANSGQCTYGMLAHPSAISALSLSKDGREAVSAGHDASIRFWSLEKRICTQDIVSHRAMRGEGVCDVCWSQDGRLVVSAGGDGVVKVFAR